MFNCKIRQSEFEMGFWLNSDILKNYLDIKFSFNSFRPKVVEEWRLKCEDLSTELDSSQRDCRQQSSDLFRLRAAWDETVEQLDSVRRENKNLGDEIKDLLDQLGEGGRSIHELDKQRRRLQVFSIILLDVNHESTNRTCR